MAGEETAIFPLWSGRSANISFPADMNAAELDMLNAYLNVFLKRAKKETEQREVDTMGSVLEALDKKGEAAN